MTMATDYTSWADLVNHMVPANLLESVNWRGAGALVKMAKIPRDQWADAVNQIIWGIMENQDDPVLWAMRELNKSQRRWKTVVRYEPQNDVRETGQYSEAELIEHISEDVGYWEGVVAEMLMQGWKQKEIATYCELSESKVSRLVSSIREAIAA